MGESKRESGTVKLQEVERKKVHEFKYLKSNLQSKKEFGREAKNQVQSGWSGLEKV